MKKFVGNVKAQRERQNIKMDLKKPDRDVDENSQ
jgi:hypothetical protein